MATSSAGVCSMPERMNREPSKATNTAPMALNDWARFSRLSELCSGPSVVTYGFAATSRNDCPEEKQAGDEHQRYHVASFGNRDRSLHQERLCHCAIEMNIAAIDEQVLPGGMA